MAGHSKWSNIRRTKEANDAKKSSIFSKLSKDIIIAARVGQTGDLNLNPILRVAVNKARAANMPGDKIQKAINRGLGIMEPGEVSYEKTYEAYGVGNVPMLIDVETDNQNRSLTEIRTVVNKAGGKMVPEGSISWQFKEFGYISASLKDVSEEEIDDIILQIIEIEGVEDVEHDFDSGAKQLHLQIYVSKDSLKRVNESLKDNMKENFEIEEVTIIKNTETIQKLDEDTKRRFLEMTETLKEIEDVTNVWFNLEE